MKYLNLYAVATIFSSPQSVWSKIRRRPVTSMSARQRVIDEAHLQFDYTSGRSDTFTIIPSLILENVLVEDQDVVQAMGAVPTDDGNWRVPKEIWSDRFLKWGQQVTPDLIDKTPRMGKTKDGKPVEGYKTVEDENQGSDSTALPIMYMMLAILGALTYSIYNVFGDDNAWLMIFPALATIPYLKAIALSEKVKEASQSFALLFAIPLIVSIGAERPLIKMIPGGVYGMAVGVLLGSLLIGLVFATTGDGEEDSGHSWIGGMWEGAKHLLKWSLIISGTIFVVEMMGLPKAISSFGLACLYPMFYSQREFNKRAGILAVRSVIYNLATKGGLASALIGAKYEQAKRAAKDKSPLFNIAIASGHLSKFKEYALAPDKGIQMVVSLRDLFQHMLIIGGTGRGKTYNTANRYIQRLVELKGKIGGYIDDGKGALVNENRQHMDVVVEPGSDFALFEGLNAQEVAKALNSKMSKSKKEDDHWAQGTNLYFDHATVLLEAFHMHEVNQRKLACEKLRELPPLIDCIKIYIAQADNELDKLVHKSNIDKLSSDLAKWKENAIKPYYWEWNGESLERLTLAMNEVREIDGGESVAGKDIMKWCAYLGFGATEEDKAKMPRSAHPEIGTGSILDNSIQYALRAWPMQPKETRGSFMSNITLRINPFMRNPLFVNRDGVPWNKLTTGVKVEEALYGKIVGPNLPEGDGDASTQVISALIKTRIYKKMIERLRMKPEEWMALGQKPMLVIWDECQDLLGPEDMNLLPKARSGQIGYVFLTQGIDSLTTAFGDKETAYNFANTCQSYICMEASKESYEYFSHRLGEAMLTSYPEMIQGIDYNGAAVKYQESVFNDKSHPNRSAIRMLQKQGAANFIIGRKRNPQVMTNKDDGMSIVDMSKGIAVNAGGTKTMQTLFSPGEFENLLLGTGRAIVCLNRAGVRRVDYVKFPIDESSDDVPYSPF